MKTPTSPNSSRSLPLHLAVLTSSAAIMLDYAAANIAGLDLSTQQAGDLLQQMGAFGISNYLTGIMLILIGWKARSLALVMLGVIPSVYAIGYTAIKINSAPYAPTQAAWGGATPMLVYLAISGITFIAGGWITLNRKRQRKDNSQLDQPSQ